MVTPLFYISLRLLRVEEQEETLVNTLNKFPRAFAHARITARINEYFKERKHGDLQWREYQVIRLSLDNTGVSQEMA